jgi:predicted TIM-barrel fold metal-dependent hydrolase
MAARDFDVFDCHQHMGSTADAHGVVLPGQVRGGRIVAEEVATRLRFMDDGGIRQAVAIPGHTYDRSDGIAATRRQNDAIAAYRDHRPDRFPVAAGIVEPLDEAAGLAEIDRMADELGLRAVSFHTEYQGATIDAPWVLRSLERMGELGMVPLVHASNVVLHEALWRLAKVARALPDLTIVAIEPFFTYDGLQECSFIADVAPNVVFETASCVDTDTMFQLAREIGAHRLVFGSQYYSQVHAPGADRAHDRRAAAILDEIVRTPVLTDAEKALVLGANARRLFGLTPADPTP